MRTIGAALLLGLTLSGCAQYQAERQAQAAQAQAVNDDAQCRSYGTVLGSPDYVQCRMNLDNQHAQVNLQNRAILGAYVLGHR